MGEAADGDRLRDGKCEREIQKKGECESAGEEEQRAR